MNRSYNSYNKESLQRHDVSIDEIIETLRSSLTVTIDLEPSLTGNNRVMWIGFTFNLRLLEIGIEYLPAIKSTYFMQWMLRKYTEGNLNKGLDHYDCTKKSKKPRSRELQARKDKTRAVAHQEVVAAGKIQFRLDSETMELLLRTADERCTGAGVLARMWVIERLRAETSGTANSIEDLKRRLRLVEKKIGKKAVC